MSDETKRDVFEYYLEMIKALKDPLAAETVREAIQRYDAALPDDLPVIPKAVGEWLAWCKGRAHSLKDALDGETRVSEDVFARAWVLGVCRVEETGEVVKL